jgi:hypothetical protein
MLKHLSHKVTVPVKVCSWRPIGNKALRVCEVFVLALRLHTYSSECVDRKARLSCLGLKRYPFVQKIMASRLVK